MSFVPILKTDDRSDVSLVEYAHGLGRLFTFSESGDTYILDRLPRNADNHGPVTVFSEIRDGLGDVSDVAVFDSIFELYRRVVDVNILDGDYTVAATGEYWSGQRKSKVSGTYISPVLSVNDDFGFWKSISWLQSCMDTRIVVAMKAGETEAEVLAKEWERYVERPCAYYGGYGESFVTFDLDYFNLRGGHFMFKVEMETEVEGAFSTVRDLVVSYAGKHSVFFFSNRIKIDGEDFGRMIVTASYTLPQKTEIAFGIGPGGSVDWKDYEIVDLDRLHLVPSSFGGVARIGIRLSSYDDSNTPVVHEFALSFESDGDNQLNRGDDA